MSRWGATIVGAWLLLLLGAMPDVAHASSDTMTVTTTADLGLADNPEYCGGEGPGGDECPLRAALETAREILLVNTEAVVVSVPEGHYLLNQAKGPLPLGNAHAKSCLSKSACPVTIRGAGAGRTIIDGQNATEIISLTDEAAPVTVAGVTLTHGSAATGGAIHGFSTDLTISESVLSENKATARGGAIAAEYGNLTVDGSSLTSNSAITGAAVDAHVASLAMHRSTVSGNHATYGGGLALEESGNIEADVVDSTIAGNSASLSGGGIFAEGTAKVALHYSTVTGNTAALGGGIYGASSLAIEGAILANDSPNECQTAEAAMATGANIVFGTSACVFQGSSPSGADPKLGALSAAGGLGATAPLLHGSPALDAGGSSCTATDLGAGQVDERGMSRPRGTGCDLGAFESATDASVTLVATPEPVAVGGALTLTANVSNVGFEPLTGVIVTIPIPAGAGFVSAPAGCNVAIAVTTIATCQLGSVAVGQSAVASIALRAERVGALLETASVVADQADYDAANDAATIASVVGAPATQTQSGGITGGGGPISPGSFGGAAAGVVGSALVGRAFTIDRHGNVTLRVSCTANASGGCHDALALYSRGGSLPVAAARAKAVLLAYVHVLVQAGKTITVHMRLDRAGMKLARAHARFSARLLLSFREATGSTTSHAYGVALERAGRAG